MRYVDYTTNEIVTVIEGFGNRKFIECSREPYTPERLQTLKSMDEALEQQRMKLPTSEMKKDAVNIKTDNDDSSLSLLFAFIFYSVAIILVCILLMQRLN